MAQVLEVDVRGLPVWERPGRIFERFDRLELGESVTFLTENEPRGLAGRIEQHRPSQARVEAMRMGDGEWRIVLTRVEAEKTASTMANVLRRCSVFSDLDDVACARLVSHATEKSFSKGQSLVEEGESFPYLAIIWEGVVALSATVAGRTRTFYEVFPFEIFGEIELFDGGTAVGRVSALSKSVRVLLVPAETVRQIGIMHPEVLLGLATACGQRARALAEALTAQGSMPILSRLAAVLVPYSTPDRGLAPALAPLPSMTQTQLASAAGTVKEVAARAIAELETAGALRRERGHIRYLDRTKLLVLARG